MSKIEEAEQMEEAQKVAQDLRIDYRGIQTDPYGTDMFLFNEPLFGSTITVYVDTKDLRAEVVKAIRRKQREHGIWIDRISADQGDMAAEARLLHKERTGWA
jgi:hypothetical protein